MFNLLTRFYFLPTLYSNISDDRLWTIVDRKHSLWAGDIIKYWKFGIYYSTHPKLITEYKACWIRL